MMKIKSMFSITIFLVILSLALTSCQETSSTQGANLPLMNNETEMMEVPVTGNKLEVSTSSALITTADVATVTPAATAEIVSILEQGQTQSDSICGESYIVRSGDTLREIANKCEVSLNEIIAFNDFIEDPDLIYPGWILDLTETDDSDSIVIPEEGAAATSNALYVVKAGDSLSYIARRLDLNESDILAANPAIDEADDLSTGQILLLPGSVDQPAAAVSPRVIEPGQKVNVVARGFEDNVEVIVAGGPLGEVEEVLNVTNVNGDGALRTTVTVPMDAERGYRWSFIVRESADEDQLASTNIVYVVDTTGPNESIIYNVRLNDTLSGIAVNFGITLSEILEANPQIKNNSIIYVGQDILIPGPSLRDEMN